MTHSLVDSATQVGSEFLDADTLQSTNISAHPCSAGLGETLYCCATIPTTFSTHCPV